MGSVYARGKQLWLAYVEADGKRVWKRSGFVVGEEKKAQRLLEEIETLIKAGEPVAVDTGPITLGTFAKRWAKGREHRVRVWKDDKARLERHVVPRIGQMRLDEVRPRHVRDLILELRSTDLAPRTIRHVYGLLHTMFRDAVIEERITANPCVLPANVLPPKADKDLTWRPTAVFTREELEVLISDQRILADRRVLYALKGLAGLRHGEAAGLTWGRYDASAEPLGRLTIACSYARASTKTGVTREMPVHPTLAAILAEWKLSGWEETYGRKPTAKDLIVPTRRLGMRAAEEAQVAFLRDLKLVGLRARRGHDLRRTLISLAQVDGALPHILKLVTHGPSGDIISQYTTLPWPALCAEVAKLKVSLRAGGEVLALPKVAAAGADTAGVDGTVTIAVTAPEEGPDSSFIPGPWLATPAGFEPALPA